jgi:hypothetical protein
VRVARTLKWAGGAVLVLVLLLTLTLLFGLNLLKGPITRAVSKATDRELVIERLSPRWSWVHPRFRAEGVTFANAKWGKADYLLRAEAIEATVSVLPLLVGRVVIPEVHLEKAEISLEQDAEGRKNWVMKEDPEPKEESRIDIRLLTLDEARLDYADATRDIDLSTELSTDETGVAFSVEGTYNGMPMEAIGHGGPVLSIRDDTTPYPSTCSSTRCAASRSTTCTTSSTSPSRRPASTAPPAAWCARAASSATKNLPPRSAKATSPARCWSIPAASARA